MERYSGVAWAVSEAQRSQAISDGAWDGGGHSSRDGGGMGIAGKAIEASVCRAVYPVSRPASSSPPRSG